MLFLLAHDNIDVSFGHGIFIIFDITDTVFIIDYEYEIGGTKCFIGM